MKLTSLKIALLVTISLSILSILLGFLVYKNTLIALGAWNDSNKMLVYLKTDADEAQIKNLTEKLKSEKYVASVNLVDRKSAGHSFESSMKEYASGLVTTDELIDLIPESLEIDLAPNLSLGERQKQFEQLAKQLHENEIVEDLSYSSNWLNKFERIDRFIKTMGLFFFITLLLLMSYLVSLMVRVYIDDSKAEIEVYNMLGATRWSIYKLFMVDMLWFVVISLILANVLGFFIFNTLRQLVADYGLSQLITENFRFLNLSEFFILTFLITFIIFLHSFFTISISVNKLNQITND